MTKKPKKNEATVQTTMRLPLEMYERLTKEGAQFGAEVRRHLEASFVGESIDPKTRQLVEVIIDFSGYAFAGDRTAAVPWHKDPDAFEVFKAGIAEILEGFRPERALTKAREGVDNETVGRFMGQSALHRRGLLKTSEHL